MGYIWEYGQATYEPQPVRLYDVRLERPVRLASSYDVDLWGDNHEHPRPHVVMETTTDNRIYKALRNERTRKEAGHCPCEHCRKERREDSRGSRVRGPAQTYRRLNNVGHEYTANRRQWAYGSWKEHRTYQYRGSARV